MAVDQEFNDWLKKKITVFSGSTFLKIKQLITLVQVLMSNCSSLCEVIKGTRQIGSTSRSFFIRANSQDSTSSAIQ